MSFLDSTDYLADIDDKELRSGKANTKKGFVIQFYHVATIKKNLDFRNGASAADVRLGSSATFKAFLVSFLDQFRANWNPFQTFGRMDSVQTYKNTQRVINVAFDVPSHSEKEALLNFLHLQNLIQMQYPVYETMKFPITPTQEQEGAKIQMHKGRFIGSPPYIFVKMMNWIANNDTAMTGDYSEYVDNSLVATISSVSFNPDTEEGFYYYNNNLIPKLFRVELSMTILHTNDLGYTNRFKNSDKLSSYAFGEGVLQASENASEGFTYNNRSYPYASVSITPSTFRCKDNLGNPIPCLEQATATQQPQNPPPTTTDTTPPTSPRRPRTS